MESEILRLVPVQMLDNILILPLRSIQTICNPHPGAPEQRPQVKKNIWSFGNGIGRRDLAEVVEHLYDAALQHASRKTYGTG